MVTKAVILAAGLGTRLRSVTNNEIPKPFLQIKGKSLIERSIEKLKDCGIEEIVIVSGHLSHFFEKLKEKYSGLKIIKNEDYFKTGSMASFYCAKKLINDEDILLLEGDLIYEIDALRNILLDEHKDCILLSEDKQITDDYYAELDEKNNIVKLTQNREIIKGQFGEWTGIQKISNELIKNMFKKYENEENPKLGYEYCLEKIAKERLVYCRKIDGILWSEIDDKIQLDKVLNELYNKLLEKGESKYEKNF